MKYSQVTQNIVSDLSYYRRLVMALVTDFVIPVGDILGQNISKVFSLSYLLPIDRTCENSIDSSYLTSSFMEVV